MQITRKIEVFVCENDKDLRKAHYEKLYAIRNIAQEAANRATSELYNIDNGLHCLNEDSRKLITYVGANDSPASRQNAAYTVMSKLYKDRMPGISAMLANLAQYVTRNYNADKKKGFREHSVRSYKNNLPVPYQKKSFTNLRFAEYVNGKGEKREGCFFTLVGVPFQMRFGSDRSGNRLIVERVISGEYKMCTSSIAFEKKADKKTGKDVQKIFLLLCVDIPKKEVKVNEKKMLFAFLGIMNPIICTCDVRAAKEYDSGYRFWEIGTAEEFNHRRRQIQELVKRCQENIKCTVGGKGRRKKYKALAHFHDVERNYVDTKLHTYSRLLVDMAIKHGCGTIVLLDQKKREDKAKDDNKNGNPFVFRNWSFYGLKEKIKYKCEMVGIKFIDESKE